MTVVCVFLLGVQSSVAYNSDNSVADNGDNNSVCSLGSQECRGQMILHPDDGVWKKKLVNGLAGETRSQTVLLERHFALKSPFPAKHNPHKCILGYLIHFPVEPRLSSAPTLSVLCIMSHLLEPYLARY